MSIPIAKLKLPMDFIQNLYNEYNERIADKILLGMLENRYTSLRVNTLKTNCIKIKETLQNTNIEFEEINFYKDALIVKNSNEKEIEKLEIYKSGEIYLQSLSSMIPPIILNPKPGDRVLDLTASPGSKTTQMACFMENRGYILANEIDKIRYDRLKYNIEKQGVNIAKVINKDGRLLGKEIQEKFDKVLLDAPCSGEGRFLINKPETYNFWTGDQIIKLSKLQKELFESGYKALKNNGLMVYSTCTLNKEENENIIDWAIKKFNIEILDINIKLKEITKPFTDGLDKNIEKAIKILPSKMLEGFFVCLIRKHS